MAIQIIENVKQITDLIQQYHDIELQQKMMDLKSQIIDLQELNLAHHQKIAALNTEKADLQRLLEIKGTIKRLGAFYFLDGDEDGYCPKCWEVNHVLSHITVLRHEKLGLSQACPNCKTMYHGSSRRKDVQG